MSPSRKVALCVNGEVYNHKQLEAALSAEGVDLQLKTGSDCEVILPLYEHKGPLATARSLDGMWSFIITDEENERFVIARDPIGLTPLYYGWASDGAIMVASELKAIEGVCERYEEFPPGHIYISDAEVPLQRYFKPVWCEPGYTPTAKPDLTELRTKFEAAVVKRLMCDVPYGVLVSGGLDSSLVAAIAARHAAKRVEDGGKSPAWFPRLHTFSIGIEGSPDLKMAREVADHIGSAHHEWVFTIDEGLNAVRDVIYHVETYDVTSIRASTPMFLLSRRIKAMGIKMVLSGEGADEMYGGYLYFHKAPGAKEFQEETVRKLQALHQYDCRRANKSTMAWGVEARTPFLDKDFLDFTMTMDASYKMIKGGKDVVEHDPRRKVEKYVLRKAFDTPEDPYLPDSVLWRQKEQFSDGVGYGWIDGLKDFAEESVTHLQMKSAAQRFVINPPTTKEGYLYREIYHSLFPSDSAAQTVPGGPTVACSTAKAVEWDAAFQAAAAQDPSGRAVGGVHVDAYAK